MLNESFGRIAAGDDDEGERPPSLRDKLQLHNFIRDIAWTNLISLNKLMGTPPDNMIYSSIFDELARRRILQLCSSLTMVYEYMILNPEHADLVVKWRLYERLRYITCVSEWVRGGPELRA